MTMGDRVAVLSDGERVAASGRTPERRCTSEPANAFVATFVGTPAMNVLDADDIDGEDARVTFGVGFRPEHVALDASENTLTVSGEVSGVERLELVSRWTHLTLATGT